MGKHTQSKSNREVVGDAMDGRWVVAEGWASEHDYWVHVWCLRDGVITSFRE
uniref:Uncharacterized protein n=1 Tax=Aegilops tauschii TaxID=37682 RepID=N1R3G6_AEGTA